MRTGLLSGLTTFLTMAYIIFVNPSILQNAGMDFGAVFVATCLAAAVATLVLAVLFAVKFALLGGGAGAAGD